MSLSQCNAGENPRVQQGQRYLIRTLMSALSKPAPPKHHISRLDRAAHLHGGGDEVVLLSAHNVEELVCVLKGTKWLILKPLDLAQSVPWVQCGLPSFCRLCNQPTALSQQSYPSPARTSCREKTAKFISANRWHLTSMHFAMK